MTLCVLELQNAVLAKKLHTKIKLINLEVNHARHSIIRIKNILKIEKVTQVLVYTFQLAVVLVLIRKVWLRDLRIIARSINSLDQKFKHEKSLWHKWISQLLIKKWFFEVDHIIAQSRGMKEELESLKGKKDVPITVIFNFLEQNPVLSKIETQRRGHSLLFVGKLKEQKNLFFLIDTIEIAMKSEPRLLLTLVGDGDQREELEDYVFKKRLSQQIKFEGKQIDVNPYYASANLLVLTSHYEGFPNVLIEANGWGLPVVSVDCPHGPSDIVIPGINGLLVKDQSKESFAEAIVQALNMSWDKSIIVSTIDRFSREIAVNQFLTILQEKSFYHAS